jgi:hypothetical protein
VSALMTGWRPGKYSIGSQARAGRTSLITDT